MRSSESTPNRTDSPIPLYLVLAGEDHPRACTGRRLLRLGLVEPIERRSHRSRAPILLDPHGERPLAPDDAPAASAGGLIVVDCSWNRLNARGGYPSLGRNVPARAPRRRLPILLATNPQHFGRVAELNTAEAFAAALSILGRPEASDRLLEPFAGGTAFGLVNAAALEAYSRVRSSAEIVEAEARLFGPPAESAGRSRPPRPGQSGTG